MWQLLELINQMYVYWRHLLLKMCYFFDRQGTRDATNIYRYINQLVLSPFLLSHILIFAIG